MSLGHSIFTMVDRKTHVRIVAVIASDIIG